MFLFLILVVKKGVKMSIGLLLSITIVCALFMVGVYNVFKKMYGATDFDDLSHKMF